MTPTEQAQSLIADFFEHQKFPAAPERCSEGLDSHKDTPKSASAIQSPIEDEPFRDDEAEEHRYGR